MTREETILYIRGAFPNGWSELLEKIESGSIDNIKGYRWNGSFLYRYGISEIINKADVFPFKPSTSTTLPEGVTRFVAIDKWGEAENIVYKDGAYKSFDYLYDDYIIYDLSDTVLYVYERQ